MWWDKMQSKGGPRKQIFAGKEIHVDLRHADKPILLVAASILMAWNL